MSILDEIKKDHNKVRDLLKAAEKLIDGYPHVDEKVEETLIQKILNEIAPHSKAEEEVFYRALRRKDEENLQPYEGTEEHHLALQLIKTTQKNSLKKPQRTAKLQVLKELLLHHMNEEENKFFSKAKKCLNTDELNDLGKKFIKRKEEIIRSQNAQHSFQEKK